MSIAQAKMVKALASGLRGSYDIRCCFVDALGPLREELEAEGVITYSLGSKSFHRAHAVFSFRRLLRELRPAILHDHYGGPLSRIIAKLAGVPVILLHVHSQIPGRQLRPWAGSCLFSDFVVATSRAVARSIRGNCRTVIYPGVGIDLATHIRSNAATWVIGTVGRLSDEKGMSFLIRAMGLLRESIPELRLEILGDGPRRGELEALVSESELTSRVRFLGWQKDIKEHLIRWDLCVLPSLEEGFGMAAAEAMATGLPVIASRVGGIPEVIVNDKTGWLVEPGDPEELACKIYTVLTDSSKRLEIAEAGRRFAVEHFSIEEMSRKIGVIYDKLQSGDLSPQF